MAESAFSLSGFQTPEQVRQRIGKARLAEEEALAGNFTGNSPADFYGKAAFRAGRGIGQAINPSQESPEVALAKRRQTLLKNIDLNDPKALLDASKSFRSADDLQAAVWTADRARSISEFDKKIGAEKAAALKPSKAQEKLGKQMDDVARLREQGRHAEADILEARIQEQKTQEQATARASQMKTVDTALGNTFGIDPADLDEVIAPQYQVMQESAIARLNAGEKVGAIRREMKRYLTFEEGNWWPTGGDDRFILTEQAKKDLKAKKIALRKHQETGEMGLVYIDSKGNPTKFITYLPPDFTGE